MSVTMQNRFEYSPEHVWSLWHVLRAILVRKGHLLETSLSAEIVDGFPYHTDVGLFGKDYGRYSSWERKLNEQDTPYGHIGRLNSKAESFDQYFNYATFCFLTYAFDCLRRDQLGQKTHIELTLKAYFEAVQREENDPRGACAWLANMLDEYGIRHPIISTFNP